MKGGEGKMAQAQGFRCPACGAEFKTQAALEEHGRKEHAAAAGPTSGFRCPACGAEFTTQTALEEHGRTAHRH